MIIIMWARVCIVLHNLIIRIEGDNFDARWRECLMRTGLNIEREWRVAITMEGSHRGVREGTLRTREKVCTNKER
jgi:hypothetical protein